ncbi:hypothetical protein EV130_1199 [Rhizobium azibense]|uniref:PaaA-like N-terminal domain-containing protein n=2 Tax=Rhizobium/Agrobacterium group TaxID=227290 RepID=A0A4V2V985_9HYPH|nr:hypothetical protein EV130_1199 [Rhizobium azibense]
MVKWGFIRPYGPPEAALYFLTSWKIASDGLGQMKGSNWKESQKSRKIIQSPPPWVAGLVSKLDGEHTLPRILSELKSERYDVTKCDVHDFVSALASCGLIEES